MQTNKPPNRRFLLWMLFIFTGLIGIETGAASFVAVVVFPLWASSAEAARGWTLDMPYHLEEGDFFMFASPATMLAAILTLIAGWKAPQPIRKLIMIATISFIIVFIWSMVYFVPIQDVSLKGDASSKFSAEELDAKLNAFVSLNYVRVAMVYVSFICMMISLRHSHKVG